MTLPEVAAQFRRLSVLVVGDVCLDRWCYYDPTLAEPSAETGIPRVAVVRTVVTPGAAGTVANNLAALHAGKVTVLGAVGDDGNGLELRRALVRHHSSADLLVQSDRLSTFTYTKLINEKTGVEDRPRVDVINREDVPVEVEAEICELLEQHGPSFDAILVSDQAETERGGVVTARVREVLANLAQSNAHQVIWVDSRRRAAHFRHMILKINDREAAEATRSIGRPGDYAALRAHMGAPLLLVTCGPEGVILLDDEGERRVFTMPVAEPVDICGAGDSFSAGGALAYAVTRSADWAARVGNLAASVTIMKPGTGPVSKQELCAAGEAAVR